MSELEILAMTNLIEYCRPDFRLSLEEISEVILLITFKKNEFKSIDPIIKFLNQQKIKFEEFLHVLGKFIIRELSSVNLDIAPNTDLFVLIFDELTFGDLWSEKNKNKLGEWQLNCLTLDKYKVSHTYSIFQNIKKYIDDLNEQEELKKIKEEKMLKQKEIDTSYYILEKSNISTKPKEEKLIAKSKKPILKKQNFPKKNNMKF